MLCRLMRRMRLKERVLVLLIGVTCCLLFTFLVLTTSTNPAIIADQQQPDIGSDLLLLR